nr:3-oxo-5-alpha-steroid 4-dehydrogenase 2-like [Ziziphus jujuba var. spinosa]
MVSPQLKLIFPPPPSVFINALSVVSLISSAILGLSESIGKKNLQYSKFCQVSSQNSSSIKKIKLPSRLGMLLEPQQLFLYLPAFIAALIPLLLFPHENIRTLLLSSTLTLHFFKRVFEVLFVHKYSGGIVLDSVIQISLAYFLSTASLIYAQHLTKGLAEPEIDLKYTGVVLFLIGIIGNFYHHYILSQLRANGEKEYKIPKGGLFGFVICPHYLFEIIGFIGLSFISQTLHALSITTGIIFYLMGRSYATRRWYISKFEVFPKNVKALIPYVL